MIEVSIKLVGPLRNKYKTSPKAKREVVELEPGSTVAQLLDCYGVLSEALTLVTVNRKKAQPSTVLEDGDEVWAIPPAAGG